MDLRDTRIKKAMGKEEGYNVYAKKISKWIKLNINPITKTQAQNLGSYVTDTSLAATFQLRKTSKTAREPKLNIPKGYFRSTITKFRDYKIKGKSKIPLKDSWIEKRKHRLDTKLETKSIQAARKSLLKTNRKKKKKGLV
jgi:hypothetical protein